MTDIIQSSTGECFGPGSGVDDAGHCFCDDSVNAMKDPSDADNCICKPYHLLNDAEDGCIMCAGPGAFIKDDECSCHTSKNAVPIRSVFKTATLSCMQPKPASQLQASEFLEN